VRLDTHLSPWLLQLLAARQLPPWVAVTLVIQHLADCCPECRRAVAAFQEKHPGLELSEALFGHRLPELVQEAFHHPWAALGWEIPGGDPEDQPVGEPEMFQLTGRTWKHYLRTHPDLHHAAVWRRLLGWASEPEGAGSPLRYQFLDAARYLLTLLPRERWTAPMLRNLEALTLAARADLHLRDGQFQAAQVTLDEALSLPEAGDRLAPQVEAELTLLVASLARLRRLPEVALGALDVALGLYQACAAWPSSGLTLLRRGWILAAMGQMDRARPDLEAGLALVDPQRCPALVALALGLGAAHRTPQPDRGEPPQPVGGSR